MFYHVHVATNERTPRTIALHAPTALVPFRFSPAGPRGFTAHGLVCPREVAYVAAVAVRATSAIPLLVRGALLVARTRNGTDGHC
jgi:hypothetical protein